MVSMVKITGDIPDFFHSTKHWHFFGEECAFTLALWMPDAQ